MHYPRKQSGNTHVKQVLLLLILGEIPFHHRMLTSMKAESLKPVMWDHTCQILGVSMICMEMLVSLLESYSDQMI